MSPSYMKSFFSVGDFLNSGHNPVREIDAPSLIIMKRQFMMSVLCVS